MAVMAVLYPLTDYPYSSSMFILATRVILGLFLERDMQIHSAASSVCRFEKGRTGRTGSAILRFAIERVEAACGILRNKLSLELIVAKQASSSIQSHRGLLLMRLCNRVDSCND